MILALFKIFGLFLLIFALIMIFFVIGVFQKIFGKNMGNDRRNRHASSIFGSSSARSRHLEQCPSCHQPIMVGKDPGQCPKCNTSLGRNHEGKLLIRVN